MSATLAIPAAELTRLIKLLGMLGSDHDGEVAAAGRKAHQWVRAHKTTWQALLTPHAVVVAKPAPDWGQPYHREFTDWREVARELLRAPMQYGLRERELEFVKGLIERNRRNLSEKQAEWLRDIAWRAGLSW